MPPTMTAPTGLEFKDVGVAGVKTSDDGIVEAIVSVTGLIDNVKDNIKPGAYAKTLATRNPKGVWSHDWNTPVAKALEIRELPPGSPELPKSLADGSPWPAGAGGLYVKALFNLDSADGRKAFSSVKFFGPEQEWSIGYNVPTGGATIDQKTGIREINHLELYEFSPVLFGAMSNARSVKDALAAAMRSGTQDEFMIEVKEMLGALGLPLEEDEEPVTPVPATDKVAEPEAAPASTDTGPVPKDDSAPSAPEQVEELREVADDLESMREEAQETPLAAPVIAALKNVQQGISELLALVSGGPQTAEAKSAKKSAEGGQQPISTVSASKVRKAMDDLINGSFDADVIDKIDNGVIAFEGAIKAANPVGIQQSADVIITELSLAMQAADPESLTGMKALATAVGAELQKSSGAAPAAEEDEDEEEPKVTPKEEPEEKTMTMTEAELKEMQAYAESLR